MANNTDVPHLYQKLRKLKKLAWEAADEDAHEKRALTAKTADLTHELKGALGVVAAAYGVSDPLTKRFLLFQNPSLYPDRSREESLLPGLIHIPYNDRSLRENCSDPDAIGNALDAIWFARRTMHTFPDDAPEFYSHLEKCPAYSRIFVDDMVWSELMEHDRVAERVVHCPADEVAFCVYAWRCLLYDALHDNTSGQRTQCFPSTTSAWTAAEHQHLWEQHTPESLLSHCAILEHLRPGCEVPFQNSVQRGWIELERREAEIAALAGGDRVLREWESIGLISSGGASHTGLQEMLSYAARVALKWCNSPPCYEHDIGAPVYEPPDDFVRDEVRKCAKLCQQYAKRKMSDDTLPRITATHASELDRALRTIIYALLSTTKQYCPAPDHMSGARQLLSTLHSITRFPIMPIYYASLARAMVVEHVVFPVFESYSVLPIDVSIPIRFTQAPRYLAPDCYKTESSPVLVSVLLNLTPYWTRKLKRGRDWLLGRKAAMGVGAVRAMFERLTAPLVEKKFLAEIAKRAMKQEGQEEGREEQSRNMFWMQAHESQNFLALLRKGTSDFVMDGIRAWFTVLYGVNKLTTPAEWEEFLPTGFGEGNTLLDLVRSSARIAGRLRYLERTEGQHSRAAMDKAGEDLEKSIDPIGDEGQCLLSPQRKEVAGFELGATAASLVCLLSNAMKHMESASVDIPAARVSVWVEPRTEVRPTRVVLENQGQGQGYGRSRKLFNTLEACRSWVAAWGSSSDVKEVRIEPVPPDSNNWRSVLPIPKVVLDITSVPTAVEDEL